MFRLIQKMIFYLKQEQLSPALLPFRHDIFSKLQESLKDQEEKLRQYKSDPDSDTTNSVRNYKTVIYSMEIEKVSYILKHYLKIRLDKVCPMLILKRFKNAHFTTSRIRPNPSQSCQKPKFNF